MPVANSQYLSQIAVAHWLVENSPIKLQIARVWPFMGIAGRELQYARRNDAISNLATVVTSPQTATVVGENSDTVAQATFPLLEFITRYQVPFGAQDVFQDVNDVDAALYALALRRLMYSYFKRLDAAAGVPGALRSYLSNGLVMNGQALTLDCLDQAYDMVTAGDGRPSVIMSRSQPRRVYHALCRAAGFEPPKVPYDWYDPARGWTTGEGEVTAFNGTPWLANDVMDSDTRIYFMVLGDDGSQGPTRGVTGIVPEALQQSMFVRRETAGVITGVGADVNTVTDVWVSWPAGVAVGSQGAISLIEDFTFLDPQCGLVE
jgi:hypothetical protein